MRRSLSCWLVPVLTLLALTTPSLRAQTIEDQGFWTAVFSQGDLEFEPGTETRWRWWFDGHARFQDDADGFNVSIVRPGIGYKLTDTATVWAGYGWIRTDPISDTPDFDEHRIWQQITWSTKAEDTTFGFRSRFEQRFVETGDDVGWRFRQLVSARQPLAGSDRFTLVAWDEVFIHLNDTDFGTRTGFNQNRAFLGVGWVWNPETPKSRVEIGYLNQFIDSSSGSNRMNHLLSVNFFLR